MVRGTREDVCLTGRATDKQVAEQRMGVVAIGTTLADGNDWRFRGDRGETAIFRISSGAG